MKPMPLILLKGNAGVGKDTAALLILELYGEENVFVTASAKPLKELARRKFNDDQLYGPSENRNQLDSRFSTIEYYYKYLFLEDSISSATGTQALTLVNELVDWSVESGYTIDQALQPAVDAVVLLSRYAEVNEGLTPRIVLQLLGTEFGRAMDKNLWIKQSSKMALESISNGKAISIITDGRFLNEVFAVKRLNGIVIEILGSSTITSEHQSEAELGSIPPTLIDYTIYNNKNEEESLTRFKDKLEQILYPLISSQIVSWR